jgi:Helix-turn-helix domain
MANNQNTKTKGLAAQTTNPESKTTKPNFNDNSAHNQRLKILDWLFEKGSITTDQAREHLDVMHPAGRIKELREAGYLIVTFRGGWTSEFGIKHSVAKYVLTRKEPLESVIEREVA